MKPVQFLIGTDTFQLRHRIEEIRKELFPEGSKGFNDDRLDAKTVDMQEVVDLCNTLPMFASSRLVVLSGIEKLKDEAQEILCRYFEAPSPSTYLICTAQKIDKRTKLFKTLSSKKLITEINPPKTKDLVNWVHRLSSNRDLKVPAQAVQLLIDSVGADLELLDQQIEKLSLYVHPRKEVTPKEVGELVLQTAGEDIFAWTDQVLDGRIKQALETLEYLLNSGDAALALVSLLARHIRILLKAIDLKQKGMEPSEYASVLGVPPFVVGKYLTQSRRFTRAKLITSLKELGKLDRDLKSTGLPSQLLLEKAVRVFTNP